MSVISCGWVGERGREGGWVRGREGEREGGREGEREGGRECGAGHSHDFDFLQEPGMESVDPFYLIVDGVSRMVGGNEYTHSLSSAVCTYSYMQ